MNSELKSASSVKTGKNFSAKRIELGYSIDEACKKVFINKDYLIAIEKGNYSSFPSAVSYTHLTLPTTCHV